MQKIVSAHKDLLQQQQTQLGAHVSAAAPPFVADQEAFYDHFIKSHHFDDSTLFDEESLRAVVLQHLIREGQFRVVDILEEEHGWKRSGSRAAAAAEKQPQPAAATDADGDQLMDSATTTAAASSQTDASSRFKQIYRDMYDILDDLRLRRSVERALDWSQRKAQELRAHMSSAEELEADLAALSIAAASTTSVKSKLQRLRSLQFTLHKLQFIELLRQASNEGESDARRSEAVRAAIAHSRQHLSAFSDKHMEEIRYLMGSLLYAKRIGASPYKSLLDAQHWDRAAEMFKQEMSQLEGQPAEAPLYVALTAGAQAIPTLLKLLSVTKSKFAQVANMSAISQATMQPGSSGAGAAAGSSSSSVAAASGADNEDDEDDSGDEGDLFLSTANRKQTRAARQRQVGQLGVQVDLDPSFYFHSVFTCPVSKEMADDQNPPMLLPCGHVLAKNSIAKMARPPSQRLKCPYCPTEATLNACKRIKF